MFRCISTLNMKTTGIITKTSRNNNSKRTDLENVCQLLLFFVILKYLQIDKSPLQTFP